MDLKEIDKGEMFLVPCYEDKGVPSFVILAEANELERDGTVNVLELVVLSPAWKNLPPLVSRGFNGHEYHYRDHGNYKSIWVRDSGCRVVVGQKDILDFLGKTQGFEPHKATLSYVWEIEG